MSVQIRFSIGWGLIAVAVFSMRAQAADWPQLQGNPAHTGYTADEPKPAYRLCWLRDLEEPTQSAAQPIVAADKLYVGTGHGNLHALGRADGKTLWTYRTAAPIFGTPAWAEGIVYVNSLDHCCHAVRDADGSRLWTFETAAPLWAAPVVADGKVFVGGRDGFVYALDARSGAELWRSRVPSLVMCTPAWSEGTLYVGVGDMRVYALEGATGRRLWQSEWLPGFAMREYWLIAARGVVIAAIEHAGSFRSHWREIQQAVMLPFIEAHKNDPVLVEDEVFPTLAKRFEKHPEEQSFFVLDARTGRQKFIIPLVPVEGGGGTAIPPAVDPQGWAYFVYGNIHLGPSGNAFFGRLNLDTGRMEPLLKDRFAGPSQLLGFPGHIFKPGLEWPRGKGDFYCGFCVMDQSWAVSVGGQIAFPVRDPSWPFEAPFHNWHHIGTGEGGYVAGDLMDQRRLGGKGLFGGGFHSTCSPVAIAGKQLFHKSPRSVVFAFEGQE
jgi:outer membrane protein assembly factor BamB